MIRRPPRSTLFSLHDALPISATTPSSPGTPRGSRPAIWVRALDRSEEHTSELQSQSNLVCRLLLEKKKKTTSSTTLRHIHKQPCATDSCAARRTLSRLLSNRG